MEQHDLNASSFAEEVGVGRSSISHILSGRNKPSLDFVLSVMKRFKEVDLYWLLNGKGSYPKNNDTTIHTPSPSIEQPQVVQKQTSDLFSEEKSEEATSPLPNREIKKPLLFSKDTIGKNITKVMWFYADGTFDEFEPNL